jgi:preprotein translocase subunit SecE
MDASKRLVNLFFAATTLLAWLVLGRVLGAVFSAVGVRDHQILGKQFTSTTLLGGLAAVALAAWAWRHVRLKPFLSEVADELVKVTWPTWEETRNNTRVTIVVTVIISLILWVFDQVFGNLTSLILGG